MKAITGNRLSDGVVVYLADDDRWTQQLCAAAQFSDEDAPSVLAAAQTRVREITDAYLVDLKEDAAIDDRIFLRETIRSNGPTVRRDLGYQAENL